MKTYEYIFAAIVMVAILIAATFLTGLLPQLYRGVSEVEQLKMVAQKIMVQMLLSPGEPKNWGANITIRASDLSSFGLAVNTVFTGDVFVLDPDKVQRLSRNLPKSLFISPEKVRSLLSLGFDYDIKVEFIPALNVTMEVSSNMIKVNVSSEQGMPAENAKVTVAAVFFEGGSLKLKQSYGVTDEGGSCIINLNFSEPTLLITVVDYYGVQRIACKSIGNTSTAHFIGNFLISPRQIPDNKAYQIFPDGSIRMNSVCYSLTHDGEKIDDYYVYGMEGVEPYTVAVVALAGDGQLIAAWKDIPRSYSSVTGEVSPPLAYMLERSVKIGFSTYTLRLWVWRLYW